MQSSPDAWMRDAVEALPSAKRRATEPLWGEEDGGGVSMKERLMKMMSVRFNHVLKGQVVQFQHLTAVQTSVDDLRDQTERSFGALANRINKLDAKDGTGDRGRQM